MRQPKQGCPCSRRRLSISPSHVALAGKVYCTVVLIGETGRAEQQPVGAQPVGGGGERHSNRGGGRGSLTREHGEGVTERDSCRESLRQPKCSEQSLPK